MLCLANLKFVNWGGVANLNSALPIYIYIYIYIYIKTG